MAITLLKAMRWSREWEPSDNQFAGALLDGLAKNDRWRLCMQEPDDAYYLAGLLIRLSHLTGSADATDDDHSKLQRAHLTPAIHGISTGWLGASYSGELTIDALTRGFFGDAWISLVLRDRPMHYTMVAKILNNYRPAFLPGLSPGQIEISAGELPALEACYPN